MKLALLRSDAKRNEFPVYISNAGRTHQDAQRIAWDLNEIWGIHLIYKPDDQSKQGTFYLNAEHLSDLEIEGVHALISKGLRKYPEAYDLGQPRA